METGPTDHDSLITDHNVLSEHMEKHIRSGFIQKVYGILAAQLLLTVLVALPFNIYAPVYKFVHAHSWIWIIVCVFNLVLIVVMFCFSSVLRKFPLNFCLLFAFTLTEGVLVGLITASYDTTAVLIALGITLLVVGGLSTYAISTKSDFTGAGPYLIVFTLVLIGFGLVTLIPFGDKVNNIINKLYAAMGALLFSFYLVYDTQLIAGGKHLQYRLSIDEYVFGALALYIDIIQLFLYLLELVGSR